MVSDIEDHTAPHAEEWARAASVGERLSSRARGRSRGRSWSALSGGAPEKRVFAPTIAGGAGLVHGAAWLRWLLAPCMVGARGEREAEEQGTGQDGHLGLPRELGWVHSHPHSEDTKTG